MPDKDHPRYPSTLAFLHDQPRFCTGPPNRPDWVALSFSRKTRSAMRRRFVVGPDLEV